MNDDHDDDLDDAEEARLKDMCDDILHAAMQRCVEQGASIPMVLDRMFTAATAQAVANVGRARAVAALRLMADNVEAGALDSVIAKKLRQN